MLDENLYKAGTSCALALLPTKLCASVCTRSGLCTAKGASCPSLVSKSPLCIQVDCFLYWPRCPEFQGFQTDVRLAFGVSCTARLDSLHAIFRQLLSNFCQELPASCRRVQCRQTAWSPCLPKMTHRHGAQSNRRLVKRGNSGL